MNQENLRKLFYKYFAEPTVVEYRELLDMYSDFMLIAIKNHKFEKVNSKADGQAKLLFQMMFSKILHLKNTVTSLSFQATDGTKLDDIIDPTFLAIITRNIFETTGLFNLIYSSSKSADEKQIIYLLWVISGLSYRQKFESSIIGEEAIIKHESEKQHILELIKEIEQIDLYQAMDAKNKGKIMNRISKREFLISIDNNKVEFLSWHNLIHKMDLKTIFFENMYTYFSLYTHPSNVAVFQFRDFFKNEQKSAQELTNFNLRYATFLTSIFIADYIKLFPSVKKTFEQLPLLGQILLSYPNKFARNNDYSINDSWKALDQSTL